MLYDIVVYCWSHKSMVNTNMFTYLIEEAGEGNEPNVKQKELRIIQSLRDIENPTAPVPPPSVV